MAIREIISAQPQTTRPVARVIVENKDKSDTLDMTGYTEDIGTIRKSLEVNGVMIMAAVSIVLSVEIPDKYDYCEIFYKDKTECLFWGWIDRPCRQRVRRDKDGTGSIQYVYSVVDPLQKLREFIKWGTQKTSSFTFNEITVSGWNFPSDGKHKLTVKVEKNAVLGYKDAIMKLDDGPAIQAARGTNVANVYGLLSDTYATVNAFSAEKGVHELDFVSYDGDVYIESDSYKVETLLDDLVTDYYPNTFYSLPKLTVTALAAMSNPLGDFTILKDSDTDSGRDLYLLGINGSRNKYVFASWLGSAKVDESTQDVQRTGRYRFAQDGRQKRLFALAINLGRNHPFIPSPSGWSWRGQPDNADYMTNYTLPLEWIEVKHSDRQFNHLPLPSGWEMQEFGMDAMAFQNRYFGLPTIGRLPPKAERFELQWCCFGSYSWIIRRASLSVPLTPRTPRGLYYTDFLTGKIYEGRLTWSITKDVFREHGATSPTPDFWNMSVFSSDVDLLPIDLTTTFAIIETSPGSFSESTFFSHAQTTEEWDKTAGGNFNMKRKVREFPLYVWEAEKIGNVFYLRSFADFGTTNGRQAYPHITKISGDGTIVNSRDPLPIQIVSATSLQLYANLMTWTSFGPMWRGWMKERKMGMLPPDTSPNVYTEVDIPSTSICGNLMNCIASDVENDVCVVQDKDDPKNLKRVDNWAYNYFYGVRLIEECSDNLDLINKLRMFENAYVYTNPLTRTFTLSISVGATTGWGEIAPIDNWYSITEETLFWGVKGKFGEAAPYLRGVDKNTLDISFPFSMYWPYVFKMQSLVDDLYDRLVGSQKVASGISLPLADYYTMQPNDTFVLEGDTYAVRQFEIDLMTDLVKVTQGRAV